MCSCYFRGILSKNKSLAWEGQKSTFIKFCKPHNPVISSTISGWTNNVLREAGINTEKFKGHSTSLASTSKVGLGGLSLTCISERGSWSNASTWKRFYNRQIGSSAEKHQNKVLS